MGMQAGQLIDRKQVPGILDNEWDEPQFCARATQRPLKSLLRALDLLGLTAGWWLAYRTMVRSVGSRSTETGCRCTRCLTGVAAAPVVWHGIPASVAGSRMCRAISRARRVGPDGGH